MLKELSWYIESNRFSEIVQQLEDKAAEYSRVLVSDPDKAEEAKEELRSLCQWHMEKSGYRNEESSFIDIEKEFFDGANLNREAFNTFEKEIIKAHMYQKHLWEFMGTTGSMTVISKSAMKRDGFEYEKYLPIEYAKNHKPKSPISKQLEKKPDSVPFYLYLDGTTSTEYNPEKSKARFDVLKDKSGFDWKRKGWDPNYEITKDGWHGTYDENQSWTMVRETEDKDENFTGVKYEKIPDIELIRDGESCILYDPGFSLVSLAEKIYILTDGEVYGSEIEDAKATVKLIEQAMSEMGVSKISGICQGTKSQTKKENDSEKIISQYKKLFNEKLSEKTEIVTKEKINELKKEIIESQAKEQLTTEGKTLCKEIAALIESGKAKEEIKKSLEIRKVQVPLSVYNKADREKLSITEEENCIIQNYAVPESKRKTFSNAIISLILNRKQLLTTGKPIEEFFEIAYKDIVENTPSHETISTETTFRELCEKPESRVTKETVDTPTLEKLENAKKEIPEQKTPELQTKVVSAVDNIIRNFAAVRMSTGMTPEEAVKLAVKTAGGKTDTTFVPPVSGIVYKTPGSTDEASDKRIFSNIKLSELISDAKNFKCPTKEIELSEIVNFSDTKSSEKFHKADLFDKTARTEWYKTEQFVKSGLNVSEIEEYITREQTAKENEISVKKIRTVEYSKEKEISKKLGYERSDFVKNAFANEEKNNDISVIRPVTRAKSAETVVREMNAAGSVPMELHAASIVPNGRISRSIAEAVLKRNFNKRTSGYEKNSVSEGIKNYESVPESDDGFRKDESVVRNGDTFRTYESVISSDDALINENLKKETEAYHEADVSKVYQSHRTAKSKKQKTPEESRLAKINANYEHDKAMLAKSDPVFAKNQFWDVGHAEESGEVSERDYAKIVKSLNADKKDKILDKGGNN